MRYAGNNTEADCEGIVTSNGKATVGSYEPNAWGLYDMLGNNSELCLDWYADWDVLYPDDAKVYVDPAGSVRDDNTYVIYRGYGFSSTIGDSQYGISIAGRRSTARDYKGSNIGQVNGWRICLTLH
jgi:formylglycine-generating enzyme required for sulfatase activity